MPFNSGTWTVQDYSTLTTDTSNITVTKSGTTVSLAITGDAGIAVARGVLSATMALNPANRYVCFINQGFSGGYAFAAPLFYKEYANYGIANLLHDPLFWPELLTP